MRGTQADVIVVDTHVLLWWLSSPRKLSRAAARSLKSARRVGVAAITPWEIAMLVTKDRITLDRSPLEWIRDALDTPRVELLPLTPAIAVHAARFPPGDPADRIIAATAVVEGVALVSADERIAALAGVEIIWD
jgi:PIN domain nuclease of toxin-antitoxin system